MARWYDHDACSSGHVSLTGRLFWQKTCICAKTRRFCPFFGNTNGCAMSEGNPVHLPAAEIKTGHLWKHHPYQNDANHLQPIDQLGQSPPLQDHLDGVPWWAHHACSSCGTSWVRSRASVTFWGVAIEDGFRRHPWTKPKRVFSTSNYRAAALSRHIILKSTSLLTWGLWKYMGATVQGLPHESS